MSIEYTSKSAFASGVVTTAGNILPNANTSRRTIIIQNLGTSPLYVFLGAGADTVSNFHFILKGGAIAMDGTGGVFTEDTLSWTGIVSVAGSNISCIATAF